jgi:hypothetical protein
MLLAAIESGSTEALFWLIHWKSFYETSRKANYGGGHKTPAAIRMLKKTALVGYLCPWSYIEEPDVKDAPLLGVESHRTALAAPEMDGTLPYSKWSPDAPTQAFLNCFPILEQC